MAWLLQYWSEILLLLIAMDRFILQLWPDNTVAKMIQNLLNGLKPPAP